MKAQKNTNNRLYDYAALAIVVLSMIYWMAFSFNLYYTFHEYQDLGTIAYQMYYDIHDFNAVQGLQFIVFGNHISPDQLIFILPMFYLFQSSLTLLFIQSAVVSLTGLAVYFVTKEILASQKFGLLLCLAYTFNPGIHGLIVFDYHLEFFIVLFYLMVFYYYMNAKKLPTIISTLLLLGTQEAAIGLAAAFGISMLLYEFTINKDRELRRNRLKLIYWIFALCLVTLVIYNAIYYALQAAYPTQYSQLPSEFHIVQVALVPITLITSAGTVGSIIATSSIPTYTYSYLAYGLIVAFLGFGFSIFAVPIQTIVFALPWLIEVFGGQHVQFFLLWYEYFSFVIGGTICAAILGIKALLERKTPIWPFQNKAAIIAFIVSSTLVCVFATCAVYPFYFYNYRNLGSISEFLLFQVPPVEQTAIAQLSWVISKIPENASLITEGFLEAHVVNRDDLAVINSTQFSFTPQYVLLDPNASINQGANTVSEYAAFAGYIGTGNYMLVAQNGTAVLYEHK